MAKWRGAILLCTLLLTACTAETVQPKEQIQEAKNDENIVVTKDGKITFEIKNEIGVP